MNLIKWSSLLGIDINCINKKYDDIIFSKARDFRVKAAVNMISSQDMSWKDIDLQGSIVESIVERTPFENTEDILKFNIAITEQACKTILNADEIAVLEKIGIYANVIELGAREFISPDDSNKTVSHLGAAKETGFFFTPPSLAIRMVIASAERAPEAREIFDPATGAGVFLAYHLLINKKVTSVIGVEIDNRTSILADKLLNYINTFIKRNAKITIICDNFFDYFDKMRGHLHVDSIIMNPPYGSVKFLASDLTDISTKANLSNEKATDLGKKLRRKTIGYSAKLKKQFAGTGAESGTLEYSKLFMTAAIELISAKGTIVAITPSSWLGDETSTRFRKNIVANGWIKELWIIPEKAKMFKGVNQPTTVSILGKDNTSVISVSNPVVKIEDLERRHFSLNKESVLSVSSDKLKFPKCSASELKILVKLQKYKKIKDIEYLINARGELDLTQHKRYISCNDTGTRLIRGDHIKGNCLIPPEESSKAGYVLFDDFMEEINNNRKAKYVKMPRIAIAQCSYLQKKKRIEAAMVSPNCIIGNSCNFLAIDTNDNLKEKQFYYWLVINSYVTEWEFRIFSYNNHVSNKEIAELTCIRFENLTDVQRHILRRIIDCYYSANDFICTSNAFVALLYGLTNMEYEAILDGVNVECKQKYLKEYCVMKNVDAKSVQQHQLPSLSALDKEMISYVEPGGNWTSIPESVPSKRLDQIREMARTRGMVRTTYYSRLRYDQPAYTISTYFNRPGNGANIHPWEDRTLSLREAARLQSFPDSFIFEGNEAAIRTQIGNAVPPLLGYAIGSAIKKRLGSNAQFCDIFAGAGGLSFGMELAGFRGVAALELNKAAALTFAKNHEDSIHTIVGDINNESVQKELITSLHLRIDDHKPWVLVGGPPCQGFSTAGYRDENDTRNKLVDSYLRIIQQTQPTIVVMENVPGILSMKKGEVIRGVYTALHNLGYVYDEQPWILDAERYGVPQMRKRVIIVGAKNEKYLPGCPKPIFAKCLGRREKKDIQTPLMTEPYPITVGEAIYGLPPLMPVNEYYPKDIIIDETYSQWCKSAISTTEFLRTRGKDNKKSNSL